MGKSKYLTETIIVGLFLLPGCTKLADFGDTNVNPETTNTPATSALLTNAISGLERLSDSYPDFENWAALYCQYYSETYITGNSRYLNNDHSPMDFYSEELYDLQNIINNNTDIKTKAIASQYGANENQIAIARILKAYFYWTITDRWGDIPYKDALKPVSEINYDTQETIYKDLLKELTEAVALFTTGTPVKGDFVYNGDISKWKKFANSLRMLISLRLSKRYPLPSEYAATQLQAALDDPAGSIETNNDNFQLNFEGEIFKNPYFRMYDQGAYVGESATITSLLKYLNDDHRQSAFGSDAYGGASTLGVPYGLDDIAISDWCADNPAFCYVFHPDYREENDPLLILTASHVFLARAEAADRGWTSETANARTLYQTGITLSFLQWGLEAPDATYFNSANVALIAPFGTGANLEKIATQQYVAFYPDGVQGWSNWRRTNYPTLLPAPDAISFPPVIPRRYMYGTLDYALSKEGVEAAVERLGPNGDKMDSRVWWDKEE